MPRIFNMIAAAAFVGSIGLTACNTSPNQDTYSIQQPTQQPTPLSPQPYASASSMVAPTSSLAVPAPIIAAPAPIATYTIRRGDTLWSIAKLTYSDGHRWKDIVSMNPGLNPKMMRVGQEIILP